MHAAAALVHLPVAPPRLVILHRARTTALSCQAVCQDGAAEESRTQTEPDIEPEPEAELELKHPEKGRACGCSGLTYVPEKSTHGCVAAAPGGPPPGCRCERVAAFCPSDWTGAPIAGPLSASHSSSKSGLRRPETSSPADSRHIQTMHIQPALSSSSPHPSAQGRGAVLLGGAPISIS